MEVNPELLVRDRKNTGFTTFTAFISQHELAVWETATQHLKKIEEITMIDIANMKVPEITFHTTTTVVAVKVVKKSKARRENMKEVLHEQFIPIELYVLVENHVRKEMPDVRPQQRYTLKDMCGANFWFDLETNVRRRYAGEAFAHMVHIGIFPLEFTKYKKSSINYYRLK